MSKILITDASKFVFQEIISLKPIQIQPPCEDVQQNMTFTITQHKIRKRPYGVFIIFSYDTILFFWPVRRSQRHFMRTRI